jgi:UDP-GlcNAc:undecaprenyl-phosphate GlcNAc-1-phosphate transferase
LGGSLLGFLRHNFHPATIYMGDSGALFLGLMLGALTMTGEYTRAHHISLLSPILILGIPIFDTFFVMYIRYLRGLPVFLGSPDHMAIRLRHWGLTIRQVVGLSYLATAILGTLGILVIVVDEETAILFVGLAAVALCAAAWALKRVDISTPAVSSFTQPAVPFTTPEGRRNTSA